MEATATPPLVRVAHPHYDERIPYRVLMAGRCPASPNGEPLVAAQYSTGMLGQSFRMPWCWLEPFDARPTCPWCDHPAVDDKFVGFVCDTESCPHYACEVES